MTYQRKEIDFNKLQEDIKLMREVGPEEFRKIMERRLAEAAGSSETSEDDEGKSES